MRGVYGYECVYALLFFFSCRLDEQTTWRYSEVFDTIFPLKIPYLLIGGRYIRTQTVCKKKTHWLGKQHAYTYAYTWWFIFMFVPIFYSFFVSVLFFAIHNHLCISFELISLSIPSVRIYIIAIYFWFIFHTHVNQQTKRFSLIFS